MKTIRLPVISLAGVMLALIVYGGAYTRYSHAAIAQTAAAGLPQARPLIRAEVNDTIVDGSPGSSCWPQADGSPQCDFIEEPLPTSTVDITEGDTIKFTLDPAAPAPTELWATLPNDRNADGDPQRFDLLQTNGELTLEGLAEGPHLVEVQAVYTGDIAGNRPFVTYGFLLNIGTSVAVATDEATTEATLETTPEATTEATTETTVEATAEATGETATPETETPESTETQEATVEPTVEQPSPIATGGAVVIPLTPAATETLEPTLEATFEPTTIPTAAPTTALPPTVETLAATVEATSAATPGGITPATGASVAPELAIIVAGRSYEPIAVSACVLSQDGTQTCVNRPQNANADRVFAAPGDVAQIRFEGPRPSTIAVTIASADGVTVINRQDLPPDNLVLYTLPTAAGNYILSVEFAWPLGRATYYFRLVVGS